MSAYRDQLRRLQLDGVVAQLKEANNRVRQLIAQRGAA